MNRVVCVGASAGGVEMLPRLLSGLPADFPAPVFVVQHLEPHGLSRLPEVLALSAALKVAHPRDRDAFGPGIVYVAPPDHHLIIERSTVRVVRSPKENFTRPAIDPLFRSAALHFRSQVIAVVLTGTLDDGSAGLWTVKRRGGVTVVQDPEEAPFPEMPTNAMRAVTVDHVSKVDDMGALLMSLCSHHGTGGPSTSAAFTKALEVENAFAKLETVPRPELESIAESSHFVCPDCGGPVWRLKEGPTRYRCHTGHAYAEQSLFAAHTNITEHAMWNLLRVLEEEITLAQTMLETGEHERPTEQALRERIRKSETRLKWLRKTLE